MEPNKILIALLGCMLTLLAGCTLGAQLSEPTAIETPVTAPHKAQIPIVVATGMLTVTTETETALVINNGDHNTYVDTFLGFTIDLPKDWTSSLASLDNGPRAWFYSPCRNLAPEVLPPCSKLQITWSEETYPNLNALRAHVETKGSAYPLISQQMVDVEIAGHPALKKRSQYDVGGETLEGLSFHILREADSIVITGFGALDPVDEIVSTIKALRRVSNEQ